MRTHLVLAAVLGLSTPASAEVIPVSFVGEITGVHAALGDAFTIGGPVTGSFSIDTESPDLEPAPDEGDYEAITNLVLDVDGYAATAAEADLHVRNGVEFMPDNFFVTAKPTGADVAGLPIGSFNLSLLDDDNTVFTSEAIPATLPLAEFESATVRLFFDDGSFNRGVDVDITELQYGAPEPGPPLLLAVGALALAAARRSRRER